MVRLALPRLASVSLAQSRRASPLPPHLRPSSSCSAGSRTSSLPPIYWAFLSSEVPYDLGLALQEAIVRYKISAKNRAEFSSARSASSQPANQDDAKPDVLLLLQHRPVYTAGRREKDPEALEVERQRLQDVAPGADYVATMRGGQTTYHGPGQLVGYPILDLGPMSMSTRTYVDLLLSFLSSVLVHPSLPSPIKTLSACTPNLPVGTFINPTTKIGSIGVQVRRRVTSHGFALNVEDQVEPWFRKIVACGLADVQMVSVQGVTGKEVKVADVVDGAVDVFGKVMGRQMARLEHAGDAELAGLVRMAEQGRLDALLDAGRRS